MWVAAFTLIAAAVVAVRSDNLKRRLAYSTVSQLAYIVLAATLATRSPRPAARCTWSPTRSQRSRCSCVPEPSRSRPTSTRVSELDGLGRAMPWTFAAFLVASISLIGLPPLGGTWSKWLLMLGAVDAGHAAIPRSWSWLRVRCSRWPT